ncbi:hypothetical protein BH18CHL2_BH18CHL2_09690 [soil metagenome]
MSIRTAHRVRRLIVTATLAAWFVALTFNIAGNVAHALLIVSACVLVYELLVAEPPPA